MDDSRCRAEVYNKWTWRFNQCARKAVIDGKWCHQHNPAAVAKRRRKQHEAFDAEWAKRQLELHGHHFFDALQKIADGHNDPRGLAQETIDKFNGKKPD